MNRREFIQHCLALATTLSLRVRLPSDNEERMVEAQETEQQMEFYWGIHQYDDCEQWKTNGSGANWIDSNGNHCSYIYPSIHSDTKWTEVT